MIFQTPAILHVGSPTKDRGMRVRFETNELTDEEKLILINFDGKFGHLLYKENEFQETEIPIENAEDKTKTPSKRLRSKIWKWHKQLNGKSENFEQFYREKMERIIEQINRQLD